MRDDLRIVALCEAVKSETLREKSSSIFTQPEPLHVVTRFFFVYLSNSMQNAQGEVAATNADFMKEVERALTIGHMV